MREPTIPGEYFVYGGVSSADYGIFISGPALFNAPQRDVTVVSVPGRNGDVVFDNNRFLNIDVTYDCFIPRGFTEKFEHFKAAMLSMTGYQRIEDTYFPDHFREGYFIGPIQPVTGPLNRSGRFAITFRCKPQRYYKTGIRAIIIMTVGGSTTINNRTPFTSKPLIQIRSENAHAVCRLRNYKTSADLQAGNIYDVTINDNVTGTMYIDSETGNCYYERTTSGKTVMVPINDKVLTASKGIPLLEPGANYILPTGDITRVAIQPRWWTI